MEVDVLTDIEIERAFARLVRERHGAQIPDMEYAALHAWSIRDLERFWTAAAEFPGVRFHDAPTAVLGAANMPGTAWFPGATLNYAEHALRPGPGRAEDDVAIVFAREDGLERTVTHAELQDLVGRARAGLVRLGVGRGDRMVALAPNSVETLVAFLAVASLGAVWSSCSPDFGVRAVRDRFAQIEPSVLRPWTATAMAGSGSTSAHRADDRCAVADPAGDGAGAVPGPGGRAGRNAALGRLHGDIRGVGVPGSAVRPPARGIVLEHLKTLRLQMDLGPGERFFWFTTTGWMMWNLLVSGLLAGSTIVLFDGNPGHPDLGALWQLAERHRVTYFGTSAPYIQSCLKAGLRPRDEIDLSTLRAIGSTGSPLSTEGFRWIGDAVGGDIQICSVSGGTDMCTAFLGAAPTVPVWLGELSCAALGAAATAYDANGREVLDEVGELVLTRPMPSMQVAFWNDPDGSRLREAYFDTFPGVWRHGDWVRVTPRGSYVIYGRSDSTLNRGGIRMGTADFYAVVEGFQEVADSLVIDTTELGARDEGELLCFLVLTPETTLADVEPRLRRTLRSELSPRHVPDRFFVIDQVPRTLSGKKLEVPVKRILAGVDPEKAVSKDAVQNPEALTPFLNLAQRP